jgi:competence protein ComFA
MKPQRICPHCHQTDARFFAFNGKEFYCRKCIAFSAEPLTNQGTLSSVKKDVEFYLPYTLTKQQKALSEKIIEAYDQRQSVLVDAVTGSGKTEIVYPVMRYVLSLGGKVGFVIPRKDVVIELEPRLTSAFFKTKVSAVYGGQTDDLSGDIVILTTHQIYRFKHYFHVLIFDEVDAFPYDKNATLKAFVKRASFHTIIYLSATFSNEVMNAFEQLGGKVFHLYTRHHLHPIPVLTFEIGWMVYLYIQLMVIIHKWLKNKTPFIIFVPTIEIGIRLSRQLQFINKPIPFVYAAHEKRIEIVEAFKLQKTQGVISTSILERGITLAKLEVVIFQADHPVYSRATLIQMAGRVGRKKEAPNGKVYLLSEAITPAMEAGDKSIRFANSHLPNMPKNV